jgi:transcriptional regulator with XRE-family HTH domain
MNGPDRRAALGEFLRSRRERLAAVDLGLPARRRRRTPGLRREDVAELAGISTAWYTYLEQGRAVRPSADVLERIAGVLRLTAVERRHLLALARPLDAPGPTDGTVPPSLHRVLDGLGSNPAYVIGHTWDLLAWNRAAAALFTDFSALPPPQRNVVWYVFTDPRVRCLYSDWAGNARGLLAQFRVSCNLYAGEPRFTELRRGLRAASPEFARWWRAHDVATKLSGTKQLKHPVVGSLHLEYTTFECLERPGLALVTYMPVDTESLGKLRALAAAAECAPAQV